MVMKLGKILCSMFLFAFMALTVHKTQWVMIRDRGTKQYKRGGYVIHPKCVSTKQQIVHDRGPNVSNISPHLYFTFLPVTPKVLRLVWCLN